MDIQLINVSPCLFYFWQKCVTML